MFSQVLNQIRVNHPDSVDLHALFMAAIEGMIAEVDPHSYVLPARRLSPEREKALRDGRLHPVPISFSYAGGAAVVVSVASGSAASVLDILPGDELVAIDGAPVAARSAEELNVLLAGARGSEVRLTFERQRLDGSLVQLVRAVKREQPGEVTAVPAAFMLDDGITGYVRIAHFGNDHAARDLRRALEALSGRRMQRLVLDLRDNPGGLVEEAAKVAGEFLPRGALVYSAEGRHPETNRQETVSRSFLAPGARMVPLVVLVNRGTASAAELIAGALQDHDRALVVGRPTFGKALLMRGFPLADGSVIMLVVGHLRTPCGRLIQRRYRDVSAREYYRMSRAARDTAGLPSCRTPGGRQLYGGDGIRPDTVWPEPAPAPRWLTAASEADLPLRWVGPYLESAPALPELEQLALEPRLPVDALGTFREFAAGQGVAIPADAEADAWLQRLLVGTVATARWGPEARYRVSASSDPEVAAAVAAFDRAAALLR